MTLVRARDQTYILQEDVQFRMTAWIISDLKEWSKEIVNEVLEVTYLITGLVNITKYTTTTTTTMRDIYNCTGFNNKRF